MCMALHRGVDHRFLTRRLIPVATIHLVLSCVLATCAARVSADEKIGQRWAVLVGINDYAELQDLQFCKNDVEALASALEKAGFPQRNIFVLSDGASDVKNLPTKGNIETRIKNVLSIAADGDLVLIGFNGHGVSLGGRTYLCPMEARENDAEATMIPLLTVYDALRQSQARFKLLLVDACRNDALPAGSRSTADAAESRDQFLADLRAVPKGIATLASCAEGQKAWEEPTLHHGVFTHFLLEGLQGKADQEESGNRDQRVSLLELFDYANINTKSYVLREKDRVQTPVFFGEIAGNFDLARLDVQPTTPPKAAGPEKVITNSLGMKLVLIAAGEFEMGSRESPEELARRYAKWNAQASWFSDEQPHHPVRITKPFYLGMHEVTVGQFRQFVELQNYQTEGERDGKGGFDFNVSKGSFEQDKQYSWRTPGFTQADDHPVVNVSWNDAVAFCTWLSGQEGKRYGLPTEAQWEYACRAASTTEYCSGDDPEQLTRVGNVADAAAKEKFKDWSTVSSSDGYVFTSPVGKFQANAWGLYDMHGNVWEWCGDWCDEGYYAKSPVDDPLGPAAGSIRVLRGGGWIFVPGRCRSAYRGGRAPDFRSDFLGFRVALVLAE